MPQSARVATCRGDYLALIVALSLSSGCAQTVPLATTGPDAAGLAGRWTGSWRSGAASSKFTLQLARGSDDRLTATAVWYGLPTVRRELTGTLANGQLILGDPKTEGLALTAQRRGVGGYSLGKALEGCGSGRALRAARRRPAPRGHRRRVERRLAQNQAMPANGTKSTRGAKIEPASDVSPRNAGVAQWQSN